MTQEWQGFLSGSLHLSLSLWTFALGWFGFHAALAVHFTALHDVCSLPEYTEEAGMKEVALLSVLKGIILLIMRVPGICLLKATDPGILGTYGEEHKGLFIHQALLQTSFLKYKVPPI